MKKYSYSEIELYAESVPEIYWWASSYCKANKCCIKRFIRKNYNEIISAIEKWNSYQKAE